MLSSEAFDRWAESYDADVRECAQKEEYPFAGYFDALEQLFELADSREGASVLELGYGTGLLAKRLCDKGHPVTGVDFSAEMNARAAAAMPDARLFIYDFSEGLPPQLADERYDFIIASFALHHLTDSKKAELLRSLRGRLKPDGAVLLADVSFESREAMNLCREAYGDEWDDEEFYFIVEELREALPEYDIDTIPMSFCADVLILTPAE